MDDLKITKLSEWFPNIPLWRISICHTETTLVSLLSLECCRKKNRQPESQRAWHQFVLIRNPQKNHVATSLICWPLTISLDEGIAIKHYFLQYNDFVCFSYNKSRLFGNIAAWCSVYMIHAAYVNIYTHQGALKHLYQVVLAVYWPFFSSYRVHYVFKMRALDWHHMLNMWANCVLR